MKTASYIYRIQRKTDGKFSTGHVNPTFRDFKYAKIWKSIRALKLHVRLVREGEYYYGHDKKRIYPYDDCEIITYEIIEQKLENIKEPLSLKEYAKNDTT